MLEVESLGPMENVPPGDYAGHCETWYLCPDILPPVEDNACGDWLEGLAKDRPLLD
jgi:hypothetical protein